MSITASAPRQGGGALRQDASALDASLRRPGIMAR
jgi:hypothetical protein